MRQVADGELPVGPAECSQYRRVSVLHTTIGWLGACVDSGTLPGESSSLATLFALQIDATSIDRADREFLTLKVPHFYFGQVYPGAAPHARWRMDKRSRQSALELAPCATLSLPIYT